MARFRAKYFRADIDGCDFIIKRSAYSSGDAMTLCFTQRMRPLKGLKK